MIKIGDFVTRKKYNNDILFRVVKIENGKVFLSGVELRLYADSNLDDLRLHSISKKKEEMGEFIENSFSKDSYYIPGIILHIDSDKYYLEKCENYYKKSNVKYFGYVIKETDYNDKILKLIEKHSPDIVVITGHDAFYKDKNKYKNSNYFINAVKEIRKVNNHVILIVGACQSDYINLIKSGSTFASSPNHINIHALDPAIVASSIALSDKNKIINIEEILKKTKYGSNGIGGTIIYGTMKTIYPRINE